MQEVIDRLLLSGKTGLTVSELKSIEYVVRTLTRSLDIQVKLKKEESQCLL